MPFKLRDSGYQIVLILWDGGQDLIWSQDFNCGFAGRWIGSDMELEFRLVTLHRVEGAPGGGDSLFNTGELKL
jgi:hypothetical protein